MRVLITGASGFIGSQLGVRLSHEHEVLGTVFRSPRPLPFPHQPVDLRDERMVKDSVGSFRPQVIVHLAAMSRVVECEEKPQEARDVNVKATERILRWAERLHAKFIYLSSDQVFSGRKGGYRESDVPDPVGQYGRTKLEAEQIVLASSARTLIVRSNSVVGRSAGWGESFSDMVLGRLQRGGVLDLFEDQFRSPIHVRSMLDILQAACLLEISGLLHVGGLRRMSRLDTGYAVARAYGLSSEGIRAVSYRSHPRAAAMAADSSYDISRLKQILPFVKLRPVEEEFRADAEASEERA